jgi:hypothetical protein
MNFTVSGILDRPVKPGDDSEWLFDILNRKIAGPLLRTKRSNPALQ